LGLEPDNHGRLLEQHADIFREMGFTQFTFGTTGPDYSLDGLHAWLSWRDHTNGRVPSA
jgi:hypothetical protein